MKIDRFKYEIKETFEFAGKQKATNFILHSPKMQHLSTVAPIKQILVNAFMAQADAANAQNVKETKPSTEGAPEINGEILVMMLQGFKTDDNNFYLDLCHRFSKLITSPGICFINEDIPLLGTTPGKNEWLNKMGVRDFDDMMGEYLSFFLMPSILLKK